jgi:ribosomal protein S16
MGVERDNSNKRVTRDNPCSVIVVIQSSKQEEISVLNVVGLFAPHACQSTKPVQTQNAQILKVGLKLSNLSTK